MRNHLQSIGAAVVSLVVSGACCCAGGTGGPYIPSPRSDMLAGWQDFPADQVPRPIVLKGLFIDRPADFSGEGSVAIGCHKFTLSTGTSQPAPRQATATWTDGVSVIYPASSARDIFAAMNPTPPSNTGDCAGVAPVVVTAAPLGTDTFQTDRGPAQMTAWVFRLAVVGPPKFWSYPAVAASSIWRGAKAVRYSTDVAIASGDGLFLTITFYGFPEGSGQCESTWIGAAAESMSAVEVDPQPTRSPQGSGCPLTLVQRWVTVPLKSPLGGRVVLNTTGGVFTVCPSIPKPESPPCYFLPLRG